MPSALSPAEASRDHASSPVNSLKRRRSTASEDQREDAITENKRQRVNGSNGKASSPPANTSENGVADQPAQTEEHQPQTVYSDANIAPQSPKTARDRRKPSIADEKADKQRSKRLFGALLGNLNQPSDAKQSSRRAEIEARRKSEIKKQDDESLAREAREREKRLEWRRRRQGAVEEDEIAVRHRNLLERARFLVTEAEPRLHYKPWELRPEEEERIEGQVREAGEVVEREVAEWKARTGKNGENGITAREKDVGIGVESANGDRHAGVHSAGASVQAQDVAGGDGVEAIPIDEDATQPMDALPDEVPESENGVSTGVPAESDVQPATYDAQTARPTHEEPHGDVTDVGDDDEETVIY